MPEEDLYNTRIINLSLTQKEKLPTLLDYIEYVCITWFTFEFAVKLIVSPNRIKFFKSFLNWIDLIANLWFYIDLIYNYFLFRHYNDTHPAWDLFGTVRIMRLFRLFNHYPGLRVIIASLKASAGILRLLFFFVLVAVIIFGSLIYYSERLVNESDGKSKMNLISASSSNHNHHEYNQFSSIIEALWYLCFFT
jgi:hypothetical protein